MEEAENINYSIQTTFQPAQRPEYNAVRETASKQCFTRGLLATRKQL